MSGRGGRGHGGGGGKGEGSSGGNGEERAAWPRRYDCIEMIGEKKTHIK